MRRGNQNLTQFKTQENLVMDTSKVLFISQEIEPYLPQSEIATVGHELPQGIQEKGFEVRSFMPKYGSINERRNQLHEVIRLSGMNLIIDDTDHPLIIKVATMLPSRMQVYFIYNEDYFILRARHTRNCQEIALGPKHNPLPRVDCCIDTNLH